MVDALSPPKDGNRLPVASGPAQNLLTAAVALLAGSQEACPDGLRTTLALACWLLNQAPLLSGVAGEEAVHQINIKPWD